MKLFMIFKNAYIILSDSKVFTGHLFLSFFHAKRDEDKFLVIDPRTLVIFCFSLFENCIVNLSLIFKLATKAVVLAEDKLLLIDCVFEATHNEFDAIIYSGKITRSRSLNVMKCMRSIV